MQCAVVLRIGATIKNEHLQNLLILLSLNYMYSYK